MKIILILTISTICLTKTSGLPYDPEDSKLHTLLTAKNKDFEAFYPREAYGVPNDAVRPAHGHGSFYKFRNPALVDAKNSPAYGFRFDGGRRFNFDKLVLFTGQQPYVHISDNSYNFNNRNKIRNMLSNTDIDGDCYR